MTFNWVDYLNLAEILIRERAKLGYEEACQRSAISRAYYATFMSATQKAKAEGWVTPGREQHRAIRNHFTKTTDKDRQRIGTWLQRLADNRESADYRDVAGDIQKVAELSLLEARKVIDTLGRL